MRRFRARGNGLSLSVIEWPHEAPRATCLVLHGFMDAAATFDFVLPELASSGLRVLAPDLRGFGESDRVSGGGYYHFPDYVADVDALVREHVVGDLFVVGHSMGGTVATMYAGARPERVAKLAVLEGMGPPDSDHDMSPLRTKRWLDDLEKDPKTVPMTEEDAMKRLVTSHPRVPRDVLASRLPLLASRDGDRWTWRFDPLHRTTAPVPFFAKTYAAFAARVSCPVLYVSGGPLGWRVPDEAERLRAFPHPTHVDIDEAGHMMHWTKPHELARALTDFMR
ncbi:MAG TPA: alpha/beta hydrolase [Polyangiaceae bacterium]|jgi:pimeloyl-ACP methyl ester carboxylesterase